VSRRKGAEQVGLAHFASTVLLSGDKCQQVYLARDLPQQVTRFKAAPFGAGEVLFEALAVLGFSNGL